MPNDETRPEIYRDKAREWERLAGTTRDWEIKNKLTDLASWWRKMAEEEEKPPAMSAKEKGEV